VSRFLGDFLVDAGARPRNTVFVSG
jgi:hypothetical protein